MSGFTLLEALKLRFPELTKEEIYAKILCGEILVNGHRERNPKVTVDARSVLSTAGRKYVSRGGIKLERALTLWNIDCSGKVFLDAGSSTGGFTDCLLHFGAAGVHAVDVGYNQLAYSLRIDSRVYVHEKTNIMEAGTFKPHPDAGVADLSFRSIHGAAAAILNFVRERWMIALVKPQFEIDQTEYPSFSGVITDPQMLKNTINSVIEKMAAEGVYVSEAALSPIRGRKGNVEFLLLLKDREEQPVSAVKKRVEELAELSFT